MYFLRHRKIVLWMNQTIARLSTEAIVVFVDAIDEVGVTLSPEDIATIGDTCEKIEKGLASALEARCGVLADGAEQGRNSEIQI